MNSVLSRTADIELDNYNTAFGFESDPTTDDYATAPMMAIRPLFLREDEEEVHTSFEQAISGRLEELHDRLNRISNPSISAYKVQCNTESLPPKKGFSLPVFSQKTHQRVLVGCFGLACMMAGFDLMGLLVLHLH